MAALQEKHINFNSKMMVNNTDENLSTNYSASLLKPLGTYKNGSALHIISFSFLVQVTF